MVSRIESKIKLAKNFANKRHSAQLKKGGTTTVYKHLGSVVSRLRYIGITDKNVLSAAWLHDVLESTRTTFDELELLFGKKVASLVLCLTKNDKFSKKVRERRYLNQLKKSSINVKLIKLCDIVSNLQDIHKSKLPYQTKIKKITKILSYYEMITIDILNSVEKYPKLNKIIHEIDEVAKCYYKNRLK